LWLYCFFFFLLSGFGQGKKSFIRNPVHFPTTQDDPPAVTSWAGMPDPFTFRAFNSLPANLLVDITIHFYMPTISANVCHVCHFIHHSLIAVQPHIESHLSLCLCSWIVLVLNIQSFVFVTLSTLLLFLLC